VPPARAWAGNWQHHGIIADIVNQFVISHGT
jgi:hypothetical protein